MKQKINTQLKINITEETVKCQLYEMRNENA
jgi:hypothetical protein